MSDQELFKTRLRTKGQVTVPIEVREMLGAEPGDDLIFRIDEQGKITLERGITVPANQAWFWSQRWQRMEQEAQADIEADRVQRFSSVDAAIRELENEKNAEDRND